MGGTFGCIGEPLAPMPALTFLSTLKQYYSHAHLNFFASPIIKDSTELSAPDWLKLAQMIKHLAEAQDYQQFIIIHGTDTLAYASAFLHHIFATQYRIILTGSQFPILNSLGTDLRPHSDARANLDFAINSIATINHGVYLAFQQKLFYGNTCYKKHTEEFDAFLGTEYTPQHLPLHSLNLAKKIDLNQSHQYDDQLKNIYIEHLYLMPTSTWLIEETLLHKLLNPPHILFIQGFGSGNLPYSEGLKQALNNLLNNDCQIIISSQVLYGDLSQKYATGSWLNELNVLFDHHISHADSFARAVLLWTFYPQHWQQYWNHNDES